MKENESLKSEISEEVKEVASIGKSELKIWTDLAKSGKEMI